MISPITQHAHFKVYMKYDSLILGNCSWLQKLAVRVNDDRFIYNSIGTVTFSHHFSEKFLKKLPARYNTGVNECYT